MYQVKTTLRNQKECDLKVGKPKKQRSQCYAFYDQEHTIKPQEPKVHSVKLLYKCPLFLCELGSITKSARPSQVKPAHRKSHLQHGYILELALPLIPASQRLFRICYQELESHKPELWVCKLKEVS